MAKSKLNGVIFWFVNLYPDSGQSVKDTMTMMRDMNQPLLERLAEDGRYVCFMIPTTKEATRVVKIDYNAPYPLYMPRSADVHKFGLQPQQVEQKPKKVFLKEVEEDQEVVFNGLINLFVNFHPEVKFDIDDVMKIIQSVNEEAFKCIIEDDQYQIMIVPTTKEASRVEKIDFDMPFPRFASEGKSNVPDISKIVKDMMDANKESDDFDEIEDEELEEEKE